MQTVEQSVEVNVSPERMYQLLIDFESYPDFVPNQSAVRILSSASHRWRIEFELSVVRKLRYTLDLTGEPGKSLRWELVKGDMMKANRGGWTLTPGPDGATIAHYDIDVRFAGFVPRSVSQRLVERTLPSNLNAFKREAERRES